MIVHGTDYPGQTIGEGIVQKEGMEQPHYYWDPVIAPSGLAFYTGNLFPQWKGSLFVGALRGQMDDGKLFTPKYLSLTGTVPTDASAAQRCQIGMGPAEERAAQNEPPTTQ